MGMPGKVACYIRHPRVLAQVRQALRQSACVVTAFGSPAAFLRSVQRRRFDLIVLDLATAPRPGDPVLAWLAQRASDAAPVLVLAPHRHAASIARVLQGSVNEVLARTDALGDLTTRVHALLRPAPRNAPSRTVVCGGFTLDEARGRCQYHGRDAGLTRREWCIAWRLFTAPGVACTPADLAAAVGPAGGALNNRAIAQHVIQLRKKLQAASGRPAAIRSAPGQGYWLEADAPGRQTIS